MDTRHVSHSISLVYMVGLLLGLGILGCAKKEQPQATDADVQHREGAVGTESIADIQRREGVPVQVISVTPRTLQVIEKAGGTVEGYYQSEISSGAATSIISINVKVGDSVEKDDILVRLDPTAASSQYRQAKAAYESAEKAYARAEALSQEGGVPQELLDQAETGYTVTKANFDAATKSVNLLAPFSGTVVEIFEPLNRNVDIGTALIKMAKLDTIRVKMNINEALIDRYRVGQSASIEMSDQKLMGRVVKVPLAGSPETHSFFVEAIFPHPERILRPGMFVTVQVVVNERRNALALPVESVLSEGQDKYVFVVRDKTAHEAPLKVGIRGGDAFEIIEGLQPGDRVVSAGASRLSEGAKVKVLP